MFVGIDLGTSGVKCLAIDADGEIVAESRAGLTSSRPKPGWSEQDPRDWWSATNTAILDLPPDIRRACKGLGLSGQMHGAVCLDASDEIIRPAILWDDGRSAEACKTLSARVPNIAELTGNIPMPGFTAPKLLWMQEHEQDAFARTAKVLLPKDYLRLRMTGAYASDMSDTAGTLWLDTRRREWSAEMLEATDLTSSHMPELFEGTEVTATLSSDVASAWGMDRIPVAGGAGDNAAGAVGMGVIEPRQGVMSIGTSGTIFVADDAFPENVDALAACGVHTFCHALPERWHRMSVMLSAARCLDWAASVLGLADAAELDQIAGEGSPDGEVFLPYLMGERTPHNNSAVRGAFLGLSASTTQGTLARAVLEGIAFGMADGWDALSTNGSATERLSVVGGGARSRLLGEILAILLDVPLDYHDGATVGPALGAARLAHIAATGAFVREVCTPPPVTHSIEPSNSATLTERRSRYQTLSKVILET